MAKLTTKERNALPSSDFAEPAERKYPIEDAAHRKNALSRVSQFGSSKEKATIRKKVKSRAHEPHPSINEDSPNPHNSKVM